MKIALVILIVAGGVLAATIWRLNSEPCSYCSSASAVCEGDCCIVPGLSDHCGRSCCGNGQ